MTQQPDVYLSVVVYDRLVDALVDLPTMDVIELPDAIRLTLAEANVWSHRVMTDLIAVGELAPSLNRNVD